MFCDNCGREIADDSNFCEFCGNNLEETNSGHEPDSVSKAAMTDHKGRKNKYIIPILILFPLLFGVIYFSQNDSRNQAKAQESLLNMNLDYRDQKAFENAIEKSQNNIVELFLKAGSIMPQTKNDALLYLAGSDDTDNSELIKTLIKYGADVNFRDKYGVTPLFKAVNDKNDGNVVDILLGAGADPTVLSTDGGSVLLIAVVTCPVATVKNILDKGGKKVIDKTTYNHRTPLSYAVSNNRLNVANLLIQYGASPNYIDRNGNPQIYTSK